MAVVDTNAMPPKRPLPGWDGRFFNSDNMTFGYWQIAADSAPLHEHDHPQEEIWNVVEGQLAVTVAGVEHVAGPGCAVIIPSNTRHSARAVTRCRVIVVDYPTRQRVGGVDTT
jgi:quercetin dioxygenase-like cupin family protein